MYPVPSPRMYQAPRPRMYPLPSCRMYPTIICGIAVAIVYRKMLEYASENPVKFVALGSFSVLASVPILSFVIYSFFTLMATIIGAMVIELFLLTVAIIGLAFVLFFVMCISTSVTGVFGAVYFVYRASSTILCRTKGMGFRGLHCLLVWPYTSNKATLTITPELSKPHEQGDDSGDTDKTK